MVAPFVLAFCFRLTPSPSSILPLPSSSADNNRGNSDNNWSKSAPSALVTCLLLSSHPTPSPPLAPPHLALRLQTTIAATTTAATTTTTGVSLLPFPISSLHSCLFAFVSPHLPPPSPFCRQQQLGAADAAAAEQHEHQQYLKEKNSNDRRSTDSDVNTNMNRSRQSRPITVA